MLSARSLSWLWIGGSRQGHATDSQSVYEIAEMVAESLPKSLSCVASAETVHIEDYGLYILNILGHHDALIASTEKMRGIISESRMSVGFFLSQTALIDGKGKNVEERELQGSPVAEPWHPRP